MFGYFFSRNTKSQHNLPIVKVSNIVSTIKKYEKINKLTSNNLFLVCEKVTMTPLGIFDTIDAAKTEGNKITYNNCIIIPFNVNERCKYLYTPTYESK